MPSRKIALCALIAVAVVLAGCTNLPFGDGGTADAGSIESDVKALYELANPGTIAEVISTKEESGLYKIAVKITNLDGTSNLAEAWVTKDGKLLTQSVVFVKESVSQMRNLRGFVDCLDSKGVRIIGFLNQTVAGPDIVQATFQQLNTLGSFSPKIYVPCDTSDQNFQLCLNISTSFPAIVYNNNVDPGVKTVEQLKTISGCALG